jgi:hypothetical protein
VKRALTFRDTAAAIFEVWSKMPKIAFFLNLTNSILHYIIRALFR